MNAGRVDRHESLVDFDKSPADDSLGVRFESGSSQNGDVSQVQWSRIDADVAGEETGEVIDVPERKRTKLRTKASAE